MYCTMKHVRLTVFLVGVVFGAFGVVFGVIFVVTIRLFVRLAVLSIVLVLDKTLAIGQLTSHGVTWGLRVNGCICIYK